MSETASTENKIGSPIEADVVSLVTKRLDGIKNKDEKIVKSIIDESYSKFDDWPPFRRQEAEEALKNEFGAFQVLSNYTYELKDFKVNVFGDVAIATFQLHYQGEIRSSHFEINSRVTSVLKKHDSDWKIVHEHFSRFPEGNMSEETRGTLQSTQSPSTPSGPPRGSFTKNFAALGFISAILSLFAFPEIFGSLAIVLGAYEWRRQQGNRGIIIVVLGIICMLVGLYFTAISLADLLP